MIGLYSLRKKIVDGIVPATDEKNMAKNSVCWQHIIWLDDEIVRLESRKKELKEKLHRATNLEYSRLIGGEMVGINFVLGEKE